MSTSKEDICVCEHITLCDVNDRCMKEKKLHCPLIDDPSWVYVPSAATDVARTWAKFGWAPPSQARQSAYA